jgi:hypothetical protein
VRPGARDAAHDAVPAATEGHPLAARRFVGERVQFRDRGALTVHGQFQVRERIFVVGVAAALRHQHVRGERPHRSRDDGTEGA